MLPHIKILFFCTEKIVSMLGSSRYLIKTNLQHFGTVNKRKNIKKIEKEYNWEKKTPRKTSRLEIEQKRVA